MGVGNFLSLFSGGKDPDSVRSVLIRGIFWRILAIEGILLVWSVLYRLFSHHHGAPYELFWYSLRILILIGIIVVFVVVTFQCFLTQKVIQPLEALVEANRRLQEGEAAAKSVALPEGTPREIREIASTRTHMLEEIFKVSEERLRLVHFIRKTFGRYLSEKLVDEILASPEGTKIGGHRRRVTILMSDLRGFTGMSEIRNPEEMVGLLNRYLGRMSEVIMEYDGLIDEFIGDAILAVFGIPEERKDDALRAVACGVAMQNALAALNEEMAREGHPPLEMGIGINTGDVIAGNIGSERRLKYGIVGAAVNVAARIESNTVGGQVLIGEATYDAVREHVAVEDAHTVMMKGLKHPLVYFPVKGVGSPYNLRLNVPIEKREGLALSLPFTLWPIDDKRILEEKIHGETVSIDPDGFTVRLSRAVEPHLDVMLRFDFCLQAHCFEAIYGKVVPLDGTQGEAIARIHITSIQPADRTLLDRWIDEGSL